MGNINSNSNLSNNEKQIYLREIKRLTEQNRHLPPTINNNPQNNLLNYNDKYKTNLQSKLMISQMQRQIAENQAEINRLQTTNNSGYNSSYSKISQQKTNPNINPNVIKQILSNPNVVLSNGERQQLINYLNTPNKPQLQNPQQRPPNMINNQQSQQRPNNMINNQQSQQRPNNMINNQQSNMNQSINLNQNMNQTNQFMHQNMGTRDYYQNNEIVKLNLDNNIETITKSYYNDEEQERIQFELEKKRLKQEFEDRQKRRRVEFNSKLKDFEQGPINAQKLFGLPDNYSLDMLNKTYKKLALQTHPDRNGGSNEKFRIVTQSYMLLMEKYKEKEQDKSYYDMKRDADSFFKQQKENRERVGLMEKDKFNIKIFNKVYEENRLYDPNDEGYGSWFKTEKGTHEQPKIFSDKFNLGIFNTVFEQMKEQHTSMEIEKKYDPKQLVSKSNRIGFTELGGGDIDNFGKETIKKQDLNFSDLREAYTKTHLINPNAGKFRKDYQNIEELKKDRASINFTPDKQELRRQEVERIQQRELEDRRVRRLSTYDQVAGKHYNKVHNQILGFKPDLERQLTYDS
jgi:curved DNA-binding protein CbpA